MCREARTEGSETAKSGTDEQKRYMRLLYEDKQPYFDKSSVRLLCDVHNTNHILVDAAGIGGRKKLLPAYPAGGRSWIRLGFLNTKKSPERRPADFIVSASPKTVTTKASVNISTPCNKHK